MAWYGQKNYTQMQGGGNGGKPAAYSIAQVGCFVTAFCNLLQKFGTNIDPPSLNAIFIQRGIYIDVDDGVKDDLGWASITAYDGQVQVTRTGADGWPSTNNAIVKFAYKSPSTGKPTTHFCLVADPNAHTIIDSWDGIIRSPGYYGDPVAWAEYTDVEPEPVTPQPAPEQNTITTGGGVYKMQAGDTIWSVAMRLGYDVNDLMEHNGINQSNVRNLPVGFELHLPTSQTPAPATSGVTYEALDQPRPMHVSRPAGAEKWAFGNVKTYADFKSTEHVAANTNVTIVGIATVLIGKETAAYYMDSVAFGNCAQTGTPTSTIGYNWSDLSDGSYQAPEPTPAPVVSPAPQIVPDPTTTVSDISPSSYKSTYAPLGKPTLYVTLNTIMVKELDGRRPDKQLVKNQGVEIAGTFIKDSVLYGRPSGAIKAGYWFGIPMSDLISETDLYDTSVDLKSKKAMHYPLSSKERIAILVAQTLAQLTKIQASLAKIKIKR